jgi:hypothetical protein
MAETDALVQEDYGKGFLERSQVNTASVSITIEPVHGEVVRLTLSESRKRLAISPEEAYWLGDTLMEHAKALGFDASLED